MVRVEKIYPSVIARIFGRPVEIHYEDEPAIESDETVAGSPASGRDFFADEIRDFGGGLVFEKYLEGKKGDGAKND